MKEVNVFLVGRERVPSLWRVISYGRTVPDIRPPFEETHLNHSEYACICERVMVFGIRIAISRLQMAGQRSRRLFYSFTPRPLYPRESPRYPLYKKLGGPRAGLDDIEKWKFLNLPGRELWPLGRPTYSQSLYWLRYPGSHWRTANDLKFQAN
jgi:hypothetical protein